MLDLKCVYVIVYGWVQGVYYWVFIKDKVFFLYLIGWVWNMVDGNVEFEVQGSVGNVDVLVVWVLLGLSDVIVNKVDIGLLSLIFMESYFEIIY